MARDSQRKRAPYPPLRDDVLLRPRQRSHDFPPLFFTFDTVASRQSPLCPTGYQQVITIVGEMDMQAQSSSNTRRNITLLSHEYRMNIAQVSSAKHSARPRVVVLAPLLARCRCRSLTSHQLALSPSISTALAHSSPRFSPQAPCRPPRCSTAMKSLPSSASSELPLRSSSRVCTSCTRSIALLHRLCFFLLCLAS